MVLGLKPKVISDSILIFTKVYQHLQEHLKITVVKTSARANWEDQMTGYVSKCEQQYQEN